MIFSPRPDSPFDGRACRENDELGPTVPGPNICNPNPRPGRTHSRRAIRQLVLECQGGPRTAHNTSQARAPETENAGAQHARKNASGFLLKPD